MSEIWKDIPGYEGYYQASDQGRIRSLDRLVDNGRGSRSKYKGKILSESHESTGYSLVALPRLPVGHMSRVHQMVARTFLGPCPVGCHVLHGPNGSSDNSAKNLSYGTPVENGRDRRRDGTHLGKSVRRDDGREFISATVAAEIIGVNRTCITAACTGRQKTSGGYK